MINLDADDKDWLDREARRRKPTELVRRAVHSYRLREQSRGKPELRDALEPTAGIWRQRSNAAPPPCAMRYRGSLRPVQRAPCGRYRRGSYGLPAGDAHLLEAIFEHIVSFCRIGLFEQEAD